jgi:membrane-associated phospholipid phosphatase
MKLMNDIIQTGIRHRWYTNSMHVGNLFLLFLLIVIAIRSAAPVDINRIQGTLTIVISGYVLFFIIMKRVRTTFISVALTILGILLFYGIFFDMMSELQHLLSRPWMDDLLLAAERTLWGGETGAYLQRLTHPVVTEIMMFGYVMYTPLLLITGLLIYRTGGITGVDDYLFCISLGFSLCYVGFILFPVAGPLYHHPEAFTVPLTGGYFTAWGDWMRTALHYPGGNLPSPHCTAGTIMLLLVYRYNRKAFIAMLPIFVTMIIATVYCRYHYIWDAIAGVLTGIVVSVTSPSIGRALSTVWFGNHLKDAREVLVDRIVQKE